MPVPLPFFGLYTTWSRISSEIISDIIELTNSSGISSDVIIIMEDQRLQLVQNFVRAVDSSGADYLLPWIRHTSRISDLGPIQQLFHTSFHPGLDSLRMLGAAEDNKTQTSKI